LDFGISRTKKRAILTDNHERKFPPFPQNQKSKSKAKHEPRTKQKSLKNPPVKHLDPTMMTTPMNSTRT
jgi:hypothetical protein